MSATAPRFRPPFCPNPACPYHDPATPSWPWVRAGFFQRDAAPHRIQRFQCRHCRRHFSTQTFRGDYWLKQPRLLLPVAHRLIGCSGFRQIAREFGISPQTVLGLSARIGRQCLLFHDAHRPRGELQEPLALDGFRSFERSQYHPTEFHLAIGQQSHYCHGFTDSELRRSGTMRPGQRRRRATLEARWGRPDPRSTEREVATLLKIVTQGATALTLHSDEHQDYPRALARLRHLTTVVHHTISSRAARTPKNPLFAINLFDLLVRHSGANHKRETIAFSKRRQSAAERLWLTLVWRNYVKSFSERKRDATPAMRAGVCEARGSLAAILTERRFISHARLPERWRHYYWGRTPTRGLPRARAHTLRYAA